MLSTCDNNTNRSQAPPILNSKLPSFTLIVPSTADSLPAPSLTPPQASCRSTYNTDLGQ